MTQVILTEEQAQVFRQAVGKAVQVCDPTRMVLVRVASEMNKAYIAELKRLVATPGPRYTSKQMPATSRNCMQRGTRKAASARLACSSYWSGSDQQTSHESLHRLVAS